MAQTYFGSTLRAGSGTLTDTVDGGFVVMMQTATVTTASAGTATSVTQVLPAGSAAGTQYVSSIDVFAGGRFAPTFTTAQLAAMADIGTNTNVVFTVDPNGTISTTQGVYRMTVTYAQKV